MWTAIIDITTGEIASNYQGTPNQKYFGGPWGDSAKFFHVQIPDSLVKTVGIGTMVILDATNLQATKIAGNWSIVAKS